MTTKIENIKQFLDARLCGEQNWEQLERNMYKYTDCGMWIQRLTEKRVDYESPHIEEFCEAPKYDHVIGIVVGSIVEGSDVDCTPIELRFPFTMKEFSDACDSIEGEADQIWHEWNDEKDEISVDNKQ